ncbi:hypothetical protein D9M72_541260 [compost metagenome]
MTWRSATSSLYSQGIFRTAPMARMAASPGLRIGVPASMPNTPMFVMEMVPPVSSAGLVLPARAVSVRAVSAVDNSVRDMLWASLMFGTVSPRGVAAAMPRFT